MDLIPFVDDLEERVVRHKNLIKRLSEQGCTSVQEIAKAGLLDPREVVVYAQRHWVNVSHLYDKEHKAVEERAEQIRSAISNGASSIKAIAEQINFSENSIKKVAKKYEIQLPDEQYKNKP